MYLCIHVSGYHYMYIIYRCIHLHKERWMSKVDVYVHKHIYSEIDDTHNILPKFRHKYT